MNPEIWRVCAGTSAARIPKLDSRVYYFPLGHADHSCLTPIQPSHHLRHQSPIRSSIWRKRSHHNFLTSLTFTARNGESVMSTEGVPSKFVDEKKLVAGDTIIFMKNASEKLYVGIRRNRKLVTTVQKKKMEVTEKSLAEAVEARNMEFEVLYYPKPGEWDFVVDAKIVDEAVKIGWMYGMRVKIVVEIEDSSKTVSYQGTVTSIYGSHWRMLQVEWDEPKALKNAERVSPWEVKLVSSTLGLPFLPTKKLKVDHHREGGDPRNQTLLSYDISPIGIQGSRHISFSSLVMNEPCQDMSISSSRNSSMQGLTTAPTKVTLASSQSGVFSPDHSDSSLNSFDNNTKVGCGPIRLFGKTIYPGKSDSRDSGCSRGRGDQCKGKNKIA